MCNRSRLEAPDGTQAGQIHGPPEGLRGSGLISRFCLLQGGPVPPRYGQTIRRVIPSLPDEVPSEELYGQAPQARTSILPLELGNRYPLFFHARLTIRLQRPPSRRPLDRKSVV